MYVFIIVQYAMHQTSLSVLMQTAVSIHRTSVTGMMTVEMALMNKAAVSHISIMFSALLVEQRLNS